MDDQSSTETAKLVAAVTDLRSSVVQLRARAEASEAALRAETGRRKRLQRVLMCELMKWDYDELFGGGLEAFTMNLGTELSLAEVETEVRKYLISIQVGQGAPEEHAAMIEYKVQCIKCCIRETYDGEAGATEDAVGSDMPPHPPPYTMPTPPLSETDDVNEETRRAASVFLDTLVTTLEEEDHVDFSAGPSPEEASSSSQVASNPTFHPSIMETGKHRGADSDSDHGREERQPTKQPYLVLVAGPGLAHPVLDSSKGFSEAQLLDPAVEAFGAYHSANPAMWPHEFRDDNAMIVDSYPPDSGPSLRQGGALTSEDEEMAEPEYVPPNG
ncbi:hypothetical protein B0H34DRAFT_700280 [Crassisporium funariophilum]|nr:hypothetical protein B0H34DRAFT_700280 [Crassisporium funariophilum]